MYIYIYIYILHRSFYFPVLSLRWLLRLRKLRSLKTNEIFQIALIFEDT